MKKSIFITLLLVPIYVFSQSVIKGVSIGGIGTEFFSDFTIDAQDNIYITGSFGSPMVDFDLSNEEQIATLTGGTDIFLAKYNSDFELEWVSTIGGNSVDASSALTIDGNGNVYLAGWTLSNVIDLDPGDDEALIQNNGLGRNMFVAKYGPGGDHIWSLGINGSEGTSQPNEMVLDEDENLYITGSFSTPSQINFDPSGNADPLSRSGMTDAFVAKYDSDGNYQWAFSLPGCSYCEGFGIETVDDGIYAIGVFEGESVDFDPSPNELILANTGVPFVMGSGFHSLYVAKYDRQGNPIRVFSIGGWITGPEGNGSNINFGSIKVNEDQIFLAGSFGGDMIVNPADSTVLLKDNGGFDIFLANYDTLGNYNWGTQIGGDNLDQASDIDREGNIFFVGEMTSDSIDFDPTNAEAFLYSQGMSDFFVAGYTNQGNFLQAWNMGDISTDFGRKLLFDPVGNLVIGGELRGTDMDIDPTENEFLISTNLFSEDVFIAKYGGVSTPRANSIQQDFTLFPNPVQEGWLHLNFVNLSPIGKAQFRIYNQIGQSKIGGTLDMSGKNQIDVSSLVSGLYFIQIAREDYIDTKKFIKR